MSQQYTIGCVSMTHLGLNHSVAFAEKGFHLVCFDEDPTLIESLRKHDLHVSEPGLDDLVKKNASRLSFTNDASDLQSCDLVFVACDVPTDGSGNSDLSIIHRLVELVKFNLSDKASLVLLSQVPPGFTRQIDLSKDRVFYQVETLIFGRAVERALYPERYIVGSNSPEKALPEVYKQLLDSFNCPVLVMRYESAELAKISINMFLVASVTTSNVLAEICENIGADWQEIVPALRLDKRIGEYAYLNPGLGIAGGNLERDLNTITKLGDQHGTDTDMVSAWIRNSRYRRDWVLNCLKKHILRDGENPVVCVLGLAYKPNTHSVKNSPSLAMLEQLTNCQIQTHDPLVKHAEHGDQSETIAEAVQGADVVVVMTPWDDYRAIDPELLRTQMKGRLIIDPYQALNFDKKTFEGLDYMTLGKKPFLQTIEEAHYA